MRILLVLLTAAFWRRTTACEPNDVASCVEKLPLAPNRTVNQNMLESLWTATSDAKLLEICIIYESAMPCFERKIEECGTKEDRSAVARTKRLYNFVCDKAVYNDRLTLTRSAGCILRALAAFIPSTCPISSTPYAQRMASCKALCPAYSATCRDKIQRSHRAICSVERVKNTCGDAASKLYTQLKQVMLANDFPIECDVYIPSTSNAVDNALRHAAIRNQSRSLHASSSRFRSSTPKQRWFKTSIVPFTIPTRASIVIRGSPTTTPKSRYTISRRTAPPRLGRITMIWNKLIATTKRPPTSRPITESPVEEVESLVTTIAEKEEEEIVVTTTTEAPAPEIKKVKKIIKVRRPKTKTTTTPTEETEVTEPSSTTTDPSTTKEVIPKEQILKIPQPWRPFHWLSGARTIPESILIDNFLNWKPESTRKPAEFSGVTGLPPYKRIVIEKIPEKIDWKSIHAIVTNSTEPKDGFELTHQYIKNAVEKMKKTEESAGQAVANTIDRLFTVVKSVVDFIPMDSASHLKRGFETLSRILQQAQQ